MTSAYINTHLSSTVKKMYFKCINLIFKKSINSTKDKNTESRYMNHMARLLHAEAIRTRGRNVNVSKTESRRFVRSGNKRSEMVPSEFRHATLVHGYNTYLIYLPPHCTNRTAGTRTPQASTTRIIVARLTIRRVSTLLLSQIITFEGEMTRSFVTE